MSSWSPTTESAVNALMSWSKTDESLSYSINVVQHPNRARTCGFGTKDRRPLAPACVAEMTVRRGQQIVSPDELEVAFFVAMVELWSEDGTENMTMVPDPSAAVGTTGRRRQTNPNEELRSSSSSGSLTGPPTASAPRSAPVFLSAPPGVDQHQQLFPSHPFEEEERKPQIHSNGSTDYLFSPLGTMPHLNIYAKQDQDLLPESLTLAPLSGFQSFNSSTNPASGSWPLWDQNHTSLTSGANSNQQLMHQFDHHIGPMEFPFSTPQFPSSSSSAQSASHGFLSSSSMHYPSQEQRQSTGRSIISSGDQGFRHYHQEPHQQPKFRQHPESSHHGILTDDSDHERGAEVHNLLGPIHTNATKLLDDKDRQGVFFVFQDLSIRTEGVFRLKIKLLTVANSIGALGVTQQETPVLAETWTGTFSVYPPKKFPGVPGTTPLSVAFARQGQRLPLRNRATGDDHEE